MALDMLKDVVVIFLVLASRGVFLEFDSPRPPLFFYDSEYGNGEQLIMEIGNGECSREKKCKELGIVKGIWTSPYKRLYGKRIQYLHEYKFGNKYTSVMLPWRFFVVRDD